MPRGLNMVDYGYEICSWCRVVGFAVPRHEQLIAVLFLCACISRAEAYCTLRAHTTWPRNSLSGRTSPRPVPRRRCKCRREPRLAQGILPMRESNAVANRSFRRRSHSRSHCPEIVSAHLAALAGYSVAMKAAPAWAWLEFSHRPCPIVLCSGTPRCLNTRHPKT